MSKTSFDKFAAEYDLRMGNNGDYIHRKTIDKSLLKLAGTVKNKTIYDLGCGNGYLARILVGKGAHEVWASDISPALIFLAKNKYKTEGIKYLVQNGSNFKKIPVNYFDLVIMNMTIHYLPNLSKLFRNISNILKLGGKLVFTSDHPFHSLYYFDIEKLLDFEKVLVGARLYNREHLEQIQNYWDKSKLLNVYRRPLSLFINSLSKNGLMVDGLLEPVTERKESQEETVKKSTVPSKFALSAIKIIN